MANYSWNQPTCEKCWEKKRPGFAPVRVRNARCCQCSYCGETTQSGIFTRANPATVAFPQTDD